MVSSPVVGGAFADSSATWRWSFYINLVVYAIFVPVYLFMIPTVNPQPNRSTSEKLKTMDFGMPTLSERFSFTNHAYTFLSGRLPHTFRHVLCDYTPFDGWITF